MCCTGIGRFTILDEGLITEADLGGNFFVDKTALGMPRAQRCVELLLELNSDVQGDWEPKDNVCALRVVLEIPTHFFIANCCRGL